MTKFLNFGLKTKGDGREGGTCEVRRPCHPPPKKKKTFETCTCLHCLSSLVMHIVYAGCRTSKNVLPSKHQYDA